MIKEMRFLIGNVVWGMLDFDPTLAAKKDSALTITDRQGNQWLIGHKRHDTAESARKAFNNNAWEGMVETERYDLG